MSDFDDGDWDLLSVDKHWNEQGYDGYHGSAWYRLRFVMPEDIDTRRHFWLVFSGADKEAIVYLDGERACDHTTEATGKDDKIRNRRSSLPFFRPTFPIWM